MNLKDLKAFFTSDKPADLQLLEKAEAMQEENTSLKNELAKQSATAKNAEEYAEQSAAAQAKIAELEAQLATKDEELATLQADRDTLAAQDAATATKEPAEGVQIDAPQKESFASQAWNREVSEYLAG